MGVTATAMRQGYLLCETCYLLNHAPRELAAPACVRCNAQLHARKPASLVRCWAFLAAAAILYIPANLLPVLVTDSIVETPKADTIMSGVVFLWATGSWMLRSPRPPKYGSKGAATRSRGESARRVRGIATYGANSTTARISGADAARTAASAPPIDCPTTATRSPLTTS